MNLIEKLKTFWALRRIKQEATKMDPKTMTPGWQTTEFWGKTIIQLVVVFNALSSKDIPIETATMIIAGLEAVYVAGRSVVKAITDVIAGWKAK